MFNINNLIKYVFPTFNKLYKFHDFNWLDKRFNN